jgi:hypothetical protein
MGAAAYSSSSQPGDVIKDALASNHHQRSMNANLSKSFRNLINSIRKPTVVYKVAEVPTIKKMLSAEVFRSRGNPAEYG